VYHIQKTALSFLIITGLSACNSQLSVSEACNSVSVMCKEIVDDSGCKKERAAVVFNEYDIRVKKDKSKIYQQMLALEDLQECSYKRSLIQYVSAESRFPVEPNETKERVANRESFRKSISERKKVKSDNYHRTMKYAHYYNQETEKSQNPRHLYWHYSRLNDRVALYRLIEKDKKGEVSGHDMMFFMSMIYVDADPDLVEESLLKSLEQYPASKYKPMGDLKDPSKYDPYKDEEGRLHYSVLRHLTQSYYKNEQFEKSYIFAKLLELNNDNAVSDFMIFREIKDRSEARIKTLDEIAYTAHEWLKAGEFDAWVLEQNMVSKL
jgi:hypothetical protein